MSSSSTTKRNKVSYKKGDTDVDAVTNMKRSYDGNKWRRLCSVHMCDRMSQMQGLCMRHFRKIELQQQLTQNITSSNEAPQYLPIGDFYMVACDRNDSISTIKQHLYQSDLHNHLNLDSSSKNESVEQIIVLDSTRENSISAQDYIESPAQMDFSASSIAVAQPGMSSDVLVEIHDTQNFGMDMDRCTHSITSNSICQCRNVANYKCSHCTFAFCLQHGLQHQQELREEISYLLAEAQKLFDNVEKLKINSGKQSCATLIDRWATTMHNKIDQKREELQTKLSQLDKQIEENKDHWKILLKNQIEIRVGCVLTELMQKYEIDGSKLSKARQDFVCMKKLYRLFDNQQLITIDNTDDKQVELNSPQLYSSGIVLDDLDWTKNLSTEIPEEILNWLDSQQNYMNNKSTYTISSCEGVNDNSFDANKSTEMNTNKNTKFKRAKIMGEKTSTMAQTISPIVTTSVRCVTNSTEDKQDNFIKNSPESGLLTTTELQQEIIFRSIDSMREIEMKDPESATSTSSSPLRDDLNCEKIFTVKNDDLQTKFLTELCADDVLCHLARNKKLIETSTTLDFSNSQMGDQEVRHLNDALQNNNTLITLNLSFNQIGQIGAQYLSDILRNNKTLTTLIISSNHIGNQGVRYLCDALKINKTLTVLNLERNQIGDHGAQYLSDMLRCNQTLTTLKLRWNYLGENGAQYLSDALRYNNTLLTLDLSCNQIGNKGVQHLGDALQYNTKLTTFELQCNRIEDEGAQYLSETLQNNKTLSTLNLSGNKIGVLGSQYLIDLKNKNKSLLVYWK